MMSQEAEDWERYFLDPSVVFLLEGDGTDEFVGGPITKAGYYVMPYCYVECCRPHGPFEDVVKARRWARVALVEQKLPWPA
jgi:hypothetical protein